MDGDKANFYIENLGHVLSSSKSLETIYIGN